MKMKVQPAYKLSLEMINNQSQKSKSNKWRRTKKKIELVATIIFPENAQNLQQECCGIEKRKEWKKHKEQRIQKSTLEKEKALT